MKALVKIALGAVALFGVMRFYSKSVGEQAEVHDFVLVPVKDLPSTDPIFTAFKADPALQNASVIFRITAERTVDGPLTGVAHGIMGPTGDLINVIEDPKDARVFQLSPSTIVGILKRGERLAAKGTQNQLEKGAFA